MMNNLLAKCFSSLGSTYIRTPVLFTGCTWKLQTVTQFSRSIFLSGRSEKSRYADGITVRQTGDDLKSTDSGVPVDVINQPQFASVFPTYDTHDHVFNGVKYLDLPIVHVTATSNNTKLSLNYPPEQGGGAIAIQSAGTVGFHNAKKGTNVAAQAAAIALAKDALRKDVKTVRVCLRGIGQGRLPALKALQLAGLEIVSITDTTKLAHNGNRPKKVRRL